MSESKNTIGSTFKQPHNVVIEDRLHMTLTGVSDVDSFDEQTVILFTEQGELTVKGQGLHINKLSLESGEVTVDGLISALIYQEQQQRGDGLFGKLFR